VQADERGNRLAAFVKGRWGAILDINEQRLDKITPKHLRLDKHSRDAIAILRQQPDCG
jgi:hypothetical protein